MAQALPIESVLPDLLAALVRRTELVLQAPPGAGKTTRVPLALLDQPWLGAQKVIVLEPRRLAARASARRMASLMGEEVGGTVGFRVRGESRVSPGTRVEVVTEGILIRMLQDDPALSGVGCVVFDEFHERGLMADLGLAMTLDGRAALREELRIVVMSATLDGERVAALLGDAPIVSSTGRQYPVETHYLDRVGSGRLPGLVAQAVRRALVETEGDLLVFLPGVGEIKRTQEELAGVEADVRPLYGALSFRDQERAIRPSSGRRKVVLSTDIAETSLTIEGIRTVIDTGLARRALFDPASGMSRLVTRPTSVASADQRRGRAGRLGPGICYRLWTKVDHAARTPFDEAEIRQADLASLVLELAVWGSPDPSELSWLDPPPRPSVEAARELLVQLGALSGTTPTSSGREMILLGMHPRLAHMVVDGSRRGLGQLTSQVAALLEERDVLRGYPSELPTDLRLRVDLLRESGGRNSAHGATIDLSSLRRVRQRAVEIRRRSDSAGEGTRGRRFRDGPGGTGGPRSPEGTGARSVDPSAQLDLAGSLIAAAYPDRLAQRVRDGHFRLRNGRPVTIPETDPLSAEPFLAVATVGGGQDRHRAFLAAPISCEEIEESFADDIRTAEAVFWESHGDRVVAVQRRVLDALVLRESPAASPDPTEVGRVLLDEVRRRGIQVLPWSKAARQLQQRLVFLSRGGASSPQRTPSAVPRGPAEVRFPDRTDEAILKEELLLPFLTGMTRLSDLKQLNLSEVLLSGLAWQQRENLDRRAPTHLTVPSGSRVALDYSDPEAVALPVRLQEVFGLSETPRVDGIPVTLHLLSPARRPVQITQDLRGFWQSSYFDVRKDLRGRYPKHYWPENPLEAAPTARAKPRKR